MGKIVNILFLVALLVGCKKDNGQLSTNEYEQSSDQINFNCIDESSAAKGVVSTNDNLSEIEVFAYYTAQTDWSAATSAEDVSIFMQNQYVYKNTEGVWSYEPVKYWPTNSADKLTFFAAAPYAELVCTNGSDNKPQFSYTMSQNAGENGDLLIATPNYNVTNSSASSGITFSMDHALTRLALYANLKNYSQTNYAKGEVNIRYYINGISFIGLHSTANLKFDESSKTWEWEVREGDTDPVIEYMATQGITLLATGTDAALLGSDSKSVMYDENTAIFALPQDVSTATVQVKVRKVYDEVDLLTTEPEGYSYSFTTDDVTYYIAKNSAADGDFVISSQDSELIYSTDGTSKIPTTNDTDNWSVAESIGLSFTFDAGNLSIYDTPMTISSMVLGWTSADEIVADIHSNIYIYSSDNNITVPSTATYADFMICTNYDYNMRVPHHRVELDSAITSSRGFLFCTDTDDDGSDEVFVPTLLKPTFTDSNGDGKVDDGEVTWAEVKYVTSANYTGSDATIVFGSNGYGYRCVDDAALTYNLLYYDPDNNAVTEFTYNDSSGNHEIDLSDFSIGDIDEESTVDRVHFRIYTSNTYSFDFSVRKSTRNGEDLYVSTAVGDAYYGVNKSSTDPVYILRLSIDTGHSITGEVTGKIFEDTIGAELISNGGGMITQLFPVSLTIE